MNRPPSTPPRPVTWPAITFLIITAILFGFAVTQAGAAIIAPSPAASVKTCAPREIVYDGIYRVDNDLFAGSPGRDCITVKGSSFTIDTSATPTSTGAVGEYDKVYVGQNYTSGDRKSGLPVKMTRAQAYTLHVRFGGHSSCTSSNYIEDLDLWFSRSKATADQHGNAELVIAYGWCHAFGHQVKRISIAHHWYLVSTWMTPPGAPRADQWPIFLIQAAGQVHARSIRVATFIWHLRKLGWLKTSEWLDSAAAGVECWHGCKGLTVSLTT